MARFEVDLRLDAPAIGGLPDALSEESARIRARIHRKLQLEVHSNAWVRIDLRSEAGQQTLERLREECMTGDAVAGAGTLIELLDEDEVERADWFLLVTETAENSFSLWDAYPSYKPGSLRSAHALNHTFVSETFVAACEQLNLRGLSFLRCKNAGRKPAPAWFVALPDDPLGHGLDHPWFDRRLWLREVGADPAMRSSSLDTGQSNFHQRWLRPDLSRNDRLLKPLLDLFPARAAHGSTLTGLKFVTVPRFFAQAFPDADFAYVPWGEDGPNREGKMMRFRQLMVGRRARRALIDAGLFAEKAFLPIRSVALPEHGVEVLDEHCEPVPPMYTTEELSALRTREKSLFAD